MSTRKRRRRTSPPEISALTQYERLRQLWVRYEKLKGFRPDNISYWNAKAEFADQLMSLAPPLPTPRQLIDYVYPWDLEDLQERALAKLGAPQGVSCILTPSGTTAILNALMHLKGCGRKRVLAVRPYYFTVEEVARVLGLEFVGIDPTRADGAWTWPSASAIEREAADIVWLTSPIYCASVYPSPIEVRVWLEQVRRTDAALVLDESLAFPDRSFIPLTDAEAITISVPHKALSVNGSRIGIVTFPSRNLDIFEQWSDVFAGGVGPSAVQALRQFCSPSFDAAVQGARSLVNDRRGRLRDLVSATPFLHLDEETDGHLVMAYVPRLSSGLEQDENFLWGLIQESCTAFVPGSCFGYPATTGFSIRINLLRLDAGGLGGAARLFAALSAAASRA